jgi:uncharacterized membrane protein YdjX (TVP38/TMEM64 family)
MNPINLARVFLLAAAASGLAAAWYFDLQQHLSLEAVQQYKDDLGWWAPVVFMMAFVIGELIQIPSVIWIVLAGLIWPWWIALPLSLVSALMAASTAFLAARFILGPRIHDKLPNAFHNINEWISKRPIRAIILVRLTTFLHPVVHLVLAASTVSIPAFLLGTAIGLVPLTTALVFLGESVTLWWEDNTYLLIAVVIAVIGLIILVRRFARRYME